MHVIQEMVRVDLMLFHQSGERGAVGVEMGLLYPLRLDWIAAEQPFDIGAHPLVDQFEQAGGGRIEAIVEIEDPVADVAEQAGGSAGPCWFAPLAACLLQQNESLGLSQAPSRESC